MTDFNETSEALKYCSGHEDCFGCPRFGKGVADFAHPCGLFLEAADAIDSLQSNIPRWVSADDPPRSITNKVIVYCTSDERNDYVGFGHYEKYKGVETWYNLENGKPFSEWNMTVTHWQDRPEPPKKEE